MLTFRAATPSDLQAIMVAENGAHAYPWSEKVMQRYLLKPDCVWLLEQDDQHLGHAVVTLIAGEAELLMMTVAPEFQGQGFGRRLLEHVLQHLRAAGAECMFLEVRESNAPAIALYEGIGFGENGRRRGYYPAPGGSEDALLYSMDLSDG